MVGGNGLYIKKNKQYYEVFFGIENIFKVIRVDGIVGFQPNGERLTGIRIALPFFDSRG